MCAVEARKLYLFYTENSLMQISFALFQKKRKRVRLSIRKSHSLWKVHIVTDAKVVYWLGVGVGSGVEDGSGLVDESGVGGVAPAGTM